MATLKLTSGHQLPIDIKTIYQVSKREGRTWVRTLQGGKKIDFVVENSIVDVMQWMWKARAVKHPSLKIQKAA